MNHRCIEIPLFSPPRHVIEYYQNHTHAYLTEGLEFCESNLGNRIGFVSLDACNIFEQRVHHLRMRNEMKDDYENLGLEEKKKVNIIISEMRPRHCACGSIFDCPHIPYEEVVKLHDLIWNTPPPLIYPPSQETLRQIETLPEDVQKFLLQRDLQFETEKERIQWEEEVEVEIMRREVISRYMDMSISQNDVLKPKLQSICSGMSIPEDFTVSWIITHIHFSFAQMKEIYALFFDTAHFVQPRYAYVGAGGVQCEHYRPQVLITNHQPESKKPLSSRYQRFIVNKEVADALQKIEDDLPENGGYHHITVEETLQNYDDVRIQGCFFTRKMYAALITDEEKKEAYIQRVTSILHNVAALSTINKSLTQELIGSPLPTFAAYLVKTRVEDFGLKLFEDSIRIATDPNNPFSLIFKKFEKINRDQKDIIFGLLGVDKKEGEAWICEAANCCLTLEETNSIASQVLKQFLEKI